MYVSVYYDVGLIELKEAAGGFHNQFLKGLSSYINLSVMLTKWSPQGTVKMYQ